MDLMQVRTFLGWSAVINLGLLLFSWTILTLTRDWIYNLHNRFLPMSKESWSQAIFLSYSFYKISTFVFFVVPYIVLRFFFPC